MKKNRRLLCVLAAFAMAVPLFAQSHYYHLHGDTIRGQSPIYHYTWFPTVDTMGYYDSLIIPSFAGHGYMLHQTDVPLRIIGVAATLSASLGLSSFTYDPTLDTQYVILFDATAAGPQELMRFSWTDTFQAIPPRYLEIPAASSPYQGFANECDSIRIHKNIVPIWEYYFDSAIVVTDSFYLGWDKFSPNVVDDKSSEYFMFLDYRCAMYYLYYTIRDPACHANIPYAKFLNLAYPMNSYSNLQYRTARECFHIYPIIEVDTVGLPYDTALFSCDVPQNPQLLFRTAYNARVSWADTLSLAWQVSVAPQGTSPDNGRIDSCHTTVFDIYGLSPDTAYCVYVRGRCSKSMWDGWSDWSDSLALPATAVGIAAQPDGNGILALTPNPTTGIAVVNLLKPQETSAQLELRDLTGRTVLAWQVPAGTSALDIDVSRCAAGTYILHLLTAEGTVAALRFVKR